MTIEEVKEHFKDAKVVKCSTSSAFDYTKLTRDIYEFDEAYFIKDELGQSRMIYNDGKFAEIIVYNSENKQPEKPIQYQIGIDTFERMEANCTLEEKLAFVKGNIDKYLWRKKGQDRSDFEKIIDYANWAIKQIDKESSGICSTDKNDKCFKCK